MVYKHDKFSQMHQYARTVRKNERERSDTLTTISGRVRNVLSLSDGLSPGLAGYTGTRTCGGVPERLGDPNRENISTDPLLFKSAI